MSDTLPALGVRDAGPDDAPLVADILVEAFQRDPLAAWLHPHPDMRRAAHVSMFAELLRAPPAGARVQLAEDDGAAAIWLPPGARPDGSGPPNERPEVALLFAKLAAARPLTQAWYLAFLGARRKGGGGGSALLNHGLDRLDGPVSLWTGNPANLAFYGRFGFAETSRHTVADVTAFWMLRPSQP